MTRTTQVVGATATLLAVLVLGVWTLPASNDGGGLTGTWRFTVRLSESGRSTVRFVLQQEDEVLTGTYDGSYGTLPITGTVTGTDIEFSFVIREETRVTYRGAIVGRTMEGACDYAEVSGEGTWTAERANSVWGF